MKRVQIRRGISSHCALNPLTAAARFPVQNTQHYRKLGGQSAKGFNVPFVVALGYLENENDRGTIHITNISKIADSLVQTDRVHFRMLRESERSRNIAHGPASSTPESVNARQCNVMVYS